MAVASRKASASKRREGVLMGVAEVAAHLEVEKSRVQRLLQRGILPEPTARLTTGPVWWKDEVDASGAAEFVAANRRNRGGGDGDG